MATRYAFDWMVPDVDPHEVATVYLRALKAFGVYAQVRARLGPGVLHLFTFVDGDEESEVAAYEAERSVRKQWPEAPVEFTVIRKGYWSDEETSAVLNDERAWSP